MTDTLTVSGSHDLERLKGLAEAAKATVQTVGWQEAGEADPPVDERRFRAVVEADNPADIDVSLKTVWQSEPVMVVRAQTILSLIQLIEDRDGALKSAADAIDAFALDFIMAHDGSGETSDLRQEAFQGHVRDLCAVGASIRQSLTAEPKEKGE